jgi:hypothetical protein
MGFNSAFNGLNGLSAGDILADISAMCLGTLLPLQALTHASYPAQNIRNSLIGLYTVAETDLSPLKSVCNASNKVGKQITFTP